MATAEAQVCALDRSPFLPWSALPAELRCSFDQDGNGLDDTVERQIAACVAPELRFDSAENALGASEPQTLFMARRSAAQGIEITYACLFAQDGGYATSSVCDDDHAGDFVPVRVQVDISRQLDTWLATPVIASGGSLGTVDIGQEIALNGTHAIVYLSAGKHHSYPQPFQGDAGSFGCDDQALGDGGALVPGVNRSLAHVSSTALVPTLLGAAADTNVCLLATDPASPPVPASGFHGESLDDLGYPGQSLFNSFFGLDETPWLVLTSVSGLGEYFTVFDPDLDGDGLNELITWIEAPANVGTTYNLFPPSDACPIDPSSDDPDGDSLVGACDPDDSHRNVYVAGGSSALPAYSQLASVLLGWATPKYGVYPRAGFLDQDQDAYVKGEDLCPLDSAGGLEDLNTWGEQLNFAPTQADGLMDPGALYRGDACDPYPATETRWINSGETEHSGTCDLVQWSWGGADLAVFESTVRAGRSMNDPLRDQPDGRQFLLQPLRCACEVGQQTCLSDPNSPCFDQEVRPAPPGSALGRRWRPVERPGCAHDTDGYCIPLTTDPSASLPVTWEWRGEASAHPDHFGPGDVLHGDCADGIDNDSDGPIDYPLDPDCASEEDSTEGTAFVPGWGSAIALHYTYAVATQVVNGLSFTLAPGAALAQISDFPEPEQTSEGASLLDVASNESRWLRTSFAEPRLLRSAFKTFGGVQGCSIQLPFDPCVFALCDGLAVDPQIVINPSDGFLTAAQPRMHIIWPGFAGITDTLVGSPESDSVLRVALADSTHWAASVAGSIAAAPGGGSAGLSLLWVEHAPEATRWALFTSQVEGGSFASESEGVLPFGVSPGARVMASADGAAFALFDRVGERLAVFEGGSAWRVLTPSAEVFSRDGIAAAVLGTELVVLGGAPSVAPSEGWLVHLGSGATRAWTFGAPVRLGAQLSHGAEPGTLVLVGGRDANNALHDDVWVLRPGSHDAEMLLPDSALAATFDRRVAVLPPSGPLPGAAFSISPGGGLVRQIRDAGGWRDADCPSPEVRGFALLGLQGVAVRPYATVSGGPIGALSGLTRLDAGASAGAIVAASDVTLGGAAVAAGVLAGGVATIHSTATVAGGVDGGLGFTLPSFDCLRPSPRSSNAANVLVAEDTTVDLAPGDYGDVAVAVAGTLRISSGSYRLRSLSVPLGSQMLLAESGGRTRVETETTLQLAGGMPSPAEAARILWTHFGTGPTSVAGLVGTLVAPRSSVVLSGASRGAVFARQVQLAEASSLTHQPLLGGWQ